MTVPAGGTETTVGTDTTRWATPRPAELVDVTELLVRAQSGEAREVLSEVADRFAEAREQHQHERAQWLRFVLFVSLHELRIVGTAEEIAAEMIRLAEPYEDRTWSALGHGLRATARLLQGQVEGAYDELARAVVLLEELDDPGYPGGHAINTVAVVLGHLDLFELADSWLDRLHQVAVERDDAMLQTLYAFNSTWLHLTWGFELDLIGAYDLAREQYRSVIAGFEEAPTGVGEVVRDSAWPSEVAVQSCAARAMLGEGAAALEVDLRSHLDVVAPTHRHEATLTGHLALSRAYANDGDLDRALEAAEVACAAGDTLPRLQVPVARAYEMYAALLRDRGGSVPATGAYAQLSMRLLRDRWDERRARVRSFEERLAHERVRDELRRRAAAYLTDPLTGLGNRRQIELKLPELLVDAATGGYSLVVAFIDIDDFKRVNDGLSHLAGDDVLRELADVMRAGLSGSDVLARFGGEEFVAVLPERSGKEAHTAMEDLRRKVSERSWRALPPEQRISVTIGLAESWADATRTQMLAAADEAMLNAKRAGKNRVELHTRRSARPAPHET